MTKSDRSLRGKIESNEQTPLLVTIRVEQVLPRQRYKRSIVRRFITAILGLILIGVVLFNQLPSLLPIPPPIVGTQICYSSLNTSRAYASAEALNNNIDDFCRDVASHVPFMPSGWKQSKSYYPNTPDEYTMTVSISDSASGFDRHQCTNAMSSIINDCDVCRSNRMNWKQGGKIVHGKYTYQIDIFRQNRPWPPPTKPRQSCVGWYKFILQQYDVYGAGWANYDWGQRSLEPAINPCCGLGSLTGWNFEYFDQPDENGYEWHAWFNTAIGTRRRCFDNNRVQCAAGGPCDSFCGGNG